jgi:hypothetical protein
LKTKNKIGISVTAEKAGTAYRIQVNEHPGIDATAHSRSNIARVARNAVSLSTGVPASQLVVTRVEFK